MVVEDLAVTGHRVALKVGDQVEYSVGPQKFRGEVVTYRAFGTFRDLRVRLDDGAFERLVMMPSGKLLEPVALARRVLNGPAVHDVPVAEVESCLAFAVMVRMGAWEPGEE